MKESEYKLLEANLVKIIVQAPPKIPHLQATVLVAKVQSFTQPDSVLIYSVIIAQPNNSIRNLRRNDSDVLENLEIFITWIQSTQVTFKNQATCVSRKICIQWMRTT